MTTKTILLFLFSIACLQGRCLADTVVIKGDKALGESLVKKLTMAYIKAGHTTEFLFDLTDSSFAFKSLTGNRAQIGLSTRKIKASELEAMRILNFDPEPHVAAIDLMVVIVNSANPVSELDKKQLESAFAGTTSDWNRLGGSRVPIKVFTPTRDSETYKLFQQNALNRKSFASGSKALRDDDEIMRNVRLQPGGLGFVGLPAAKSRGIKVLKIDGVKPNSQSANSYRLSRKLYYYTIQQRVKPEALAFIKWATTAPEAIRIITASGFAPSSVDPAPAAD